MVIAYGLFMSSCFSLFHFHTSLYSHCKIIIMKVTKWSVCKVLNSCGFLLAGVLSRGWTSVTVSLWSGASYTKSGVLQVSSAPQPGTKL